MVDDHLILAPTPLTATDFFALGPPECRTLDATRARRAAIVDRVIDRFQAHLIRIPELREELAGEPLRLRQLLDLFRAHFLAMDERGFDTGPLTAALHAPPILPHLHEPEWYVAWCGMYLALAISLLVETMGGSTDLIAAVDVVIKSIMRDLASAVATCVRETFVPHVAPGGADTACKHQALAGTKREAFQMLVHDLRNPLQGIALQADVTLQIATRSLEQERDHLSQINRSCRELARQLNDILEAAKLESGEMAVAPRRLAFAKFLDDVLSRHLPMIRSAGMRLTTALEADLPAIWADPGLLGRVFMNLLQNAVRHSGSEEIRVEASADSERLTVRIIDFGCGIPQPDQERVFQKYATGTVSGAATADAVGLGLYFCRLAVQSMGGWLGLTSEPGRTAFEVRLPLA